MSISIKTEDKKFVEAEGAIKAAAENIRIASLCLRMSYVTIKKENIALSEIRTNVYRRARLYNDLIMPFGVGTVQVIKNFCGDICDDDDYQVFKRTLKFKVNDAKSNVIACKLAKLFHLEILTEFKRIEDRATILKLQMNLDDKEYNKRIESLMSMHGKDRISAIELIISPNNDGYEGYLDIAAIDAMSPLTDSISMYVDSLGKVAGFFEVLFGDLSSLYKKLQCDPNDDEMLQCVYGTIIKNGRKIINSCVTYLENVPLCYSNITCIVEEKNVIDDSKWIQDVVKKAGMKAEYDEVKDIVYC